MELNLMVEELSWPRNQNYVEDVHDLEDLDHEADHLVLDLDHDQDLAPGEEVTKEVDPNPGAEADHLHLKIDLVPEAVQDPG